MVIQAGDAAKVPKLGSGLKLALDDEDCCPTCLESYSDGASHLVYTLVQVPSCSPAFTQLLQIQHVACPDDSDAQGLRIEKACSLLVRFTTPHATCFCTACFLCMSSGASLILFATVQITQRSSHSATITSIWPASMNGWSAVRLAQSAAGRCPLMNSCEHTRHLYQHPLSKHCN